MSGKEVASTANLVKAKFIAKTIGKYLLHGTLFSILLTVFSFGLGFLLLILVAIGWLLGLILWIVVLCVVIGLINTLVTSFLWFRVKTGWKVFLAHGFLLGLVLMLVNTGPVFLLWALTGTLPVLQDIVLIVLIAAGYALVDGVIGKRVARIWQTGPEFDLPVWVRSMPKAVPQIVPRNPDGLRCPRCGGTNLVAESDRSAYCIDCRKGIHPTLWAARSSS